MDSLKDCILHELVRELDILLFFDRASVQDVIFSVYSQYYFNLK